MKRKLIMNLQLFGLGQVSRPFFNADSGTGSGGSSEGGEGEDTSENNQNTDEGEKSFDDILKDKNYQSEFEKRISDAIKVEKSKWETEYQSKIDEAKTEAEKVAKMNAEQKAKYEEEKRLADLEKRERDITVRELKATTYGILAEKGLPKGLAEIINYEDAESCNKSIEIVEKAFKEAVVSAINEKIRGKQIPTRGEQVNSEDAALRKAMGL